ncbi:MAG: hypothetical protein LUQ38_01450 [Methanotrichaceae archaeon]|nr:hypothetical protein [Methanotrichaceae archaeon]
MVEYISQAMRQASHEATVLLYSPGIDPFVEDLNDIGLVVTIRNPLRHDQS